MSRDLEEFFPNLAGSGFEITGEASGGYNCIAWALGITSEPWDALDPDAYWPPSIPRDDLIVTVMRLFASEGFSLCEDDAPEPSYEKIALYAFVGQFTHVAKQLPDGRLTSKLGDLEVIPHPSLSSLAGGIYGNIHCIMRRPL